VPSSTRGSWYLRPSSTVRLASTRSGTLSNSLRMEGASSVVSVGLLWAISDPLSGVNLPAGSRMDWAIESAQQADDADFFWHVHLYLLAGSTNTVRCTLLNNHRESFVDENEWPSFPLVSGPRSQPPALSACSNARAGDRLVVEIGYVARNQFSAVRYGFLNYGSTQPDAVPGSTGGAPWIELIGVSLGF
jgi:hypothetical protein